MAWPARGIVLRSFAIFPSASDAPDLRSRVFENVRNRANRYPKSTANAVWVLPIRGSNPRASAALATPVLAHRGRCFHISRGDDPPDPRGRASPGMRFGRVPWLSVASRVDFRAFDIGGRYAAGCGRQPKCCRRAFLLFVLFVRRLQGTWPAGP